MAEPTDIRQIVFTNLRLLGFDAAASERKWRVPFNKDMFCLPNKRGFEVVMYFLFNRLNPVKCREEFRHCWEVYDKKQEQQFRSTCNNWLTQIAKEDPIAPFPRIVASLFMSPGGDKFYQLLLAFTHYVLVKVAYAEHGVKTRDILRRPILPRQSGRYDLTSVIEKTLQAATSRQRHKFLTKSQEIVAVQEEWKQYASELVRVYRSHSKSLRELEREVRAEMQIAAERESSRGLPVHKRRSGMPEYDFDVESVKRAQKVQKVRDLWKQVEDFNHARVEEREIVESILERTLDSYRIDATKLNVKVPDLLLRECEQEIQRRSVDNVYQGGKLNLVSVIHLWNLSLHLYIEKLHQAGVPNFENVEAAVTTQVHTHNAHLTNTQSLRRRLEGDTVPEMKKSIQQLKRKLDSEMMSMKSPDSLRTTSLGLGLSAPTPPISFDPAEGKNMADKTLKEQLARAEDLVSTPEAASQLIDSVSRKVRSQHNSSLTQGSPVYGPKKGIRGDAFVPQSHLPTREGIVSDKVGNKQRSRFHSAPGMKKMHIVRESTSKLKATGPRQTTVPTHQPTHQPIIDAKKHLTAQVERHKPVIKRREEDKAPKSTLLKPKNTGKHHSIAITPHVQKHSDAYASFTQSPKAHEILADQIADAVISGSGLPSHDFNLEDPTCALGTEAFESKDKLKRTPETLPRTQGGSTWHDTLLHDSLGPLSSTRIEAEARVPIDRKEAQQVATKLFSPEESDEEEHIITTGGASDVDLRYESERGNGIHQLPTIDLNLKSSPQSSPRSLQSGSDFGAASPREHRTSSLKDNAETVSLPSVSDIHSAEGSRRQSLEDNGIISQQKQSADLDSEDQLSNVSDPGAIVKKSLQEKQDDSFSSLPQNYIDKTPESETCQNGHAEVPNLVDVDASCRDLFESETPALPNRTKQLLGSPRNADEIVMSSLPERIMLSLGSPYREASPGASKSPSLSPRSAGTHSSGEVKSEQEEPVPTGLVQSQPVESGQEGEDSEATLEDIENGTQTARLIEFQNGSFSEVLVKTPSKRNRDSLSQSMDPSRGSHKTASLQARSEDLEHSSHDKLSVTLPQILMSSVDSETDSLIARYRQLRLATQKLNPNSNSRDGSFSGESQSETRTSLSPTLNEKYLQQSPGKDRFQSNSDLGMSSSHEAGQSRTPASRGSLIGRVGAGECGLDDDDFSDVKESVLAESPFATPRGTPRKGMIGSPRTPILKLSSLPISPMTAAFHREPVMEGGQSGGGTAENFDDIFAEDDSVLLLTSPGNEERTEKDAAVGQLIDL